MGFALAKQTWLARSPPCVASNARIAGRRKLHCACIHATVASLADVLQCAPLKNEISVHDNAKFLFGLFRVDLDITAVMVMRSFFTGG